ncbi:MAG: bifunctional 5,10-methylenetetrahydrofolate dehydrogenase/5,10-methenyltetrahydrofolate cyclohydrolase [Clostridia bacterium]
MAEILTGAPVIKDVKESVNKRARHLMANGINPKMSIIRVGNNPDDCWYEKSIIKFCKETDILTNRIELSEDAPENELIDAIHSVNDDPNVHGLMLFRPLPKHINDNKVRMEISPSKDIDGITDASVAGVFVGKGIGFSPCTAAACVKLLKFYHIPIAGKHIVIIGRSLVVGKPLSMMLLNENATITICHSKTLDIENICNRADILISAVGKKHLVNAKFFNDRQVVIDVGFNPDTDGRFVGDVDFIEAERFVKAITPVPGGVGGITTCILAEHTVTAAELISKIKLK